LANCSCVVWYGRLRTNSFMDGGAALYQPGPDGLFVFAIFFL